MSARVWQLVDLHWLEGHPACSWCGKEIANGEANALWSLWDYSGTHPVVVHGHGGGLIHIECARPGDSVRVESVREPVALVGPASVVDRVKGNGRDRSPDRPAVKSARVRILTAFSVGPLQEDPEQ